MLAGARLLSSLLEVVILRILDWRGIYDTEKIKSNDRNAYSAAPQSCPPTTGTL